MKRNNSLKTWFLWLCVVLGLPAARPARGQNPPGALFQYAVFYNGLMEFTDCSPMTISGPVQCNSNIYVGSPPASSLTFNSFVTCSGLITNPSWFGYPQSAYIKSNVTFNGTPVPGYGSGFPYVNLPLSTNSYRELINPPPAGESTNNPLSAQRYYNKAGLVITVTNASIIVSLKSFAYDGAPLVFVNNAPPNTPDWTNWNQANFAYWLTTNTSFYDAREMRTNHVTQIDIGRFGAWIATNTFCLPKWNSSNAFNGIIYVADWRDTNSQFMNCVRLTNGQTIPTSAFTNGAPGTPYQIHGLTVATVNPLYIKGLYNCPTAQYIATNFAANLPPCSVVCDALTILSPAWTDAASWTVAQQGSTAMPVAASSDTVNTAIIAGNVPSTGSGITQFSGGVHNLPRLLENWSSSTLWLNTSLINLYPSEQATRQFQAGGVYYEAPTRNFSFDSDFNHTFLLPPGTPILAHYPASMILYGLSAVYNGQPQTPGALTMPGLLYRITFNGSNTPPTAAGAYSIVVTINDPVYFGSTTNTFVISPAAATVNLTNLAQIYDSTAKSVSATTLPTNLAVRVTYNGSSNAPTNAGNYTVVATVTDPNYTGAVTNTLVITLPAPAPISLTGLTSLIDGSFQLNFTNLPGLGFSVLSAADPSQPLTNWDFAGSVVEIAPGQYQFIDMQATNNPQQFYIIRSP